MTVASAFHVLRDRSGAIGVVLALFLSVCVVLCSLAVDLGSLYLQRRVAQGVADLAAMAAASDLSRAEAAAQATLDVNGLHEIRSLSVIRGRYEMDRSVPHGQRFVAGKQPHNAVRVDLGLSGNLYFAKSFMSAPEVSVSAVGTSDAQATFSVGSRLVNVHGGLANAVLGSLLGGSVDLSAMDYRSLVDADVTLAGFLSALATEGNVTGGTYGQILDGNATVGNVLSALVRVANQNGQGTAVRALMTLRSQSRLDMTIPLGAVIDLGPLSRAEVGQGQSALDVPIKMMSLISAVATVANGANQVAVNLTWAVPGLLSLKLDLAIGEPSQRSAWAAVGSEGATVRTAQTRLRLIAEVGGSGLLSGVRVRLPLYIEVAHAEARLDALSCQGPQASGEVTIAARPGVVRAWIGDAAPRELSSFDAPVSVSKAKIVSAPLVAVTGEAYAEMSNVATSSLRFTALDVEDRVVKTAEVRDYLSSLTTSLLRTVDLRVDLLGLGLGGGSVSSIKALISNLLAPVAATIDSLIAPLLTLFGVHLGEVDVQVHGIRCGNAVLSG